MPRDIVIDEASDQSLLVTFGEQIDGQDHRRVLSLFRSLRRQPVRGVMNLHPAYTSLLIRFSSLSIGHAALASVVRERLLSLNLDEVSTSRLVEIPVCYASPFAPDLSDVAALHSLSEQDVIDLHASQTYTVFFLGFVPGFAYLGMVPEQIATPRLPSPRKHVPSGSVAIADRQTGIYPMSTPGGWRIVGRTPTTLFDPTRPGLSLLEPGDQVRFRPIPEHDFYAAARA